MLDERDVNERAPEIVDGANPTGIKMGSWHYRLLLILLSTAAMPGAAAEVSPFQPWVKRGVVIAPDFGGPSCSRFASGPSVVKLPNGRLRMYFWAQCGEGPEDARNVFLAAEAEARDPLHWALISERPLLGADPDIPVRDKGVALPLVLPRENGPWLMFYSALGSRNLHEGQVRSASTGLAVSDDRGLTWHVHSDEILPVGESGSFDALLTASVGALREGSSEYRLWYTAGERMVTFGPRYRSIVHIGVARSADGLSWRKDGVPALSPRLDGVDPYEAVLSRPAVLKLDGAYHMWLNVYSMAPHALPDEGRQHVRDSGTNRSPEEKGYRIEYAYSRDGSTWQRFAGQPVMALTPGGFDSKNQSYPSIVEEGDQLWMFYVGNGFGLTGIGFATLDKAALASNDTTW